MVDADELVPEGEGVLEWESGVSMFTHEPFVQLRVNGRLIAQLEPEAARGFARDGFAVAEAAEADALIYAVFTEDLASTPLDPEHGEQLAALLIMKMRQRRAADDG